MFYVHWSEGCGTSHSDVTDARQETAAASEEELHASQTDVNTFKTTAPSCRLKSGTEMETDPNMVVIEPIETAEPQEIDSETNEKDQA